MPSCVPWCQMPAESPVSGFWRVTQPDLASPGPLFRAHFYKTMAMVTAKSTQWNDWLSSHPTTCSGGKKSSCHTLVLGSSTWTAAQLAPRGYWKGTEVTIISLQLQHYMQTWLSVASEAHTALCSFSPICPSFCFLTLEKQGQRCQTHEAATRLTTNT